MSSNRKHIITSRKQLKKKKNPNTPINIRTIYNNIEASNQMTAANALVRAGTLKLQRIKVPKIFKTYMSTRSNLMIQDKPEVTEWAKDVNWKELTSNIRNWQKTNLKSNVYDEFYEYYERVRPHHLSPFNPFIHLQEIVKYGVNNGKWPVKETTIFGNKIREYLKQITWTKEDLLDVSKGHTDYNELLLEQPMFGVLRNSATSAFPDYEKQTTDYVLRKYYDSIHSEPRGYITAYHRRHGFKKVTGDDGIDRIIEKDRFVGGVEFISKIHGLPLTWSFKQSRPEFTPYYKSWDVVFNDILKNYKTLGQVYGFTTDQSGFDQIHNSNLVKGTGEIILETMPSNVASHFRQVLYKDYNNPKIIINPFYNLRLNRWMSVSGSPPTPLIETLNNLAAHEMALDDQGIRITNMLCQIDDLLCFTDKIVDLEALSKYFNNVFGFKVNPDKTEDTVRGFIVYLQNLVGDVLNEDLPTVGGDNFIFEDGVGILPFMPRRDHRLQYRERIFQTHGDIEFYEMDDNDLKQPVDVDVSRMLGTLSSLSPFCPLEYMELVTYYLKPTATFEKLVEYAKGLPVIKLGEFGWTPYPYLKYIKENF